jgi:hypothetical protein
VRSCQEQIIPDDALGKKSVRKFQNPAFCKQHAQIVSAKRSKIRQRHGMHRREQADNPASQFSLSALGHIDNQIGAG